MAQALKDIVTKVRQVNELVTEVSKASREQTDGIAQINMAVGQMDKVTQSNAATAEETAAAAEELNSQASAMKSSVNDLLRLVGGAGNIKGTSRAEAPVKANAYENGNGLVISPKRAIVTKVVKSEPVPAAMTDRRRSEIPLNGGFRDF